MLTVERETKIAEVLQADKDRMNEILAMEPEQALTELNKSGNDFTLEELMEFSEKLKAIVAQNEKGELNADDLDEVSGGIVWMAVAAGAACVAGGFACGALCNW